MGYGKLATAISPGTAAMDEPRSDNLRSTREMCREMASTVLDLFTDKLLAALDEPGRDALDRQEIAHIARQFKDRDRRRYLGRVQRIAADWLSEVERDHWSRARKRPFERLIVKRFAHLFPPAETLHDPRSVSRRGLPGLWAAFEAMAGAEFLRQCQGACRGILQQARREQDAEFRWADLYTDPGANDLVDDLLIVIAWGFRDVDRRTAWMLNLINTNLASPEDYAFEGEGVDRWRLGEAGLTEILRALFADFADKLADPEGRRQVHTRYGQRAVRALESLLEALA